MEEYYDRLTEYRRSRAKFNAILFFFGLPILIMFIFDDQFGFSSTPLYYRVIIILFGIYLSGGGLVVFISDTLRTELHLTEEYLSSPYVPSHDSYRVSILRNTKIDMDDVTKVVLYKRRDLNRFLFKLPNEKEMEIIENHLDDKDMFLKTLKRILEKKGIPFSDNVHSR